MFKIDNKIKQEALNFSTLQNCLKMTEGKFEPKHIHDLIHFD